MVDEPTGLAARIRELGAQENAEFVRKRPRSMAALARAGRTMPRGVPMSWMDDLYEHPPVVVTHGEGAYFVDLDGFRYLDMYLADMSAFCGHAPSAVVNAVAERMQLGNQFLLPSEDAIPLAEHLAARYGLAKWQFTLSATQANTEVIRIAREVTGRRIVLVFDGKYHGHIDATMVVLDADQVIPEYRGLPSGVVGEARVIPFNNTESLKSALAARDVAVVLAEPAMTNAGFILPEQGFHEALRQRTRETGTLLAIDETHTLVTAYAGLKGLWELEPDLFTIGKSIAAGVPLAAYGMTDEIAAHIAAPQDSYVVSGVAVDEIATGGTLFANALSIRAGLAAMTEVLTPAAFARTASLAAQMADGLRAAIVAAELDWSVVQVGSHGSYFFTPSAPRNGAESRVADDPDLRALMRIFMANRGVWESGWWLGPTVSVAHSEADVGRYVEVFQEFLATICPPV